MKIINEVPVFSCGTEVKTKIGDRQGMITGIRVSFTDIRYEITTEKDGNFYINYFYEQEFIVDENIEKVILRILNTEELKKLLD